MHTLVTAEMLRMLAAIVEHYAGNGKNVWNVKFTYREKKGEYYVRFMVGNYVSLDALDRRLVWNSKTACWEGVEDRILEGQI